ncbi:LOW QUALITY PROTEIN: hypothetical protein V2J09_003779 [Rumex salicifolius]
MIVDGAACHLLAIYACPTAQQRVGLWEKLNKIFLERMGGSGGLSTDPVTFRCWIHHNHLIDLGFTGNPFMWTRGNSTNTLVSKRLDRILVNNVASIAWGEAFVHHFPWLCSEHSPLMLYFRGRSWCNIKRLSLIPALSKLKDHLVKWNLDVFGSINKRKDVLMSKLKDVELKVSAIPSNFWRSSTGCLNKRNCYGTKSLGEMVHDLTTLTKGEFPVSQASDHQNLLRPITDEDIINAVGDMGAFKALGLDGFQPAFYQRFRDIVGGRLTVENFFASGELPKPMNDTLLVVIVKVLKPELISQYRSISLSNVCYKVITKTLVNRIKPMMCDLVSLMQSSFIPAD